MKIFPGAIAASAMLFLTSTVVHGQQEPGARAGSAYVPSTHTAGCGGILCDGNDPERAPGAPPPPPCQGLICGLSPYSMQRPVTASEAQRIQEERSRAAAAAAAPAPAETPTKGARKHKAKKVAKTAAKSVAVRTPDPGTPSPEPR